MSDKPAKKPRPPRKPSTGRTSKKQPGHIKEIIRLARLGLSLNAIADHLCIHPITLIRWRAEDAKFANAVKVGYALCKKDHLKTIKRASKKNWTAAAWILERRFPDDFSRKDQMRLSDAEGKNLPPAQTVIAPTVVFVQPAKEQLPATDITAEVKPQGNGHEPLGLPLPAKDQEPT